MAAACMTCLVTVPCGGHEHQNGVRLGLCNPPCAQVWQLEVQSTLDCHFQPLLIALTNIAFLAIQLNLKHLMLFCCMLFWHLPYPLLCTLLLRVLLLLLLLLCCVWVGFGCGGSCMCPFI